MSSNMVKRPSSSKVKLPILFFIGFAIAPLKSVALEFSGGFTVPVSVNYDSNIQMADSNEESIWFYNVIPNLNLIASDEVNTFSFSGSLLLQRSSDEDISQDRKDPTIGLSWLRSFERGDFTLSTNYNKASTRVSEQRVTGLIFNDGNIINRNYDASLRYLLSQKLTVITGVGYQETLFSDTNLDDFNTKNANVRLNYLYNEKMTPFVQFSLSRLENETNVVSNQLAINQSNGDTITSRNVLVGYDYKVSPQLEYSVAYGFNRISSAGSNWIGNASINYTINEQSSLVGSISRAATPTGLGGFLEIDNLAVTYLYDLNQKNHLGAEMNWSITRDVNESNFKRYDVFHIYDIGEDWGLRTYAQYRTLNATGVNADAYLIGVSLSYNHPQLF